MAGPMASAGSGLKAGVEPLPLSRDSRLLRRRRGRLMLALGEQLLLERRLRRREPASPSSPSAASSTARLVRLLFRFDGFFSGRFGSSAMISSSPRGGGGKKGVSGVLPQKLFRAVQHLAARRAHLRLAFA